MKPRASKLASKAVRCDALFPELERRRNEAWHAWQRLVTTYPNDQVAINAAHAAATECDREWAAAYSGNDEVERLRL